MVRGATGRETATGFVVVVVVVKVWKMVVTALMALGLLFVRLGSLERIDEAICSFAEPRIRRSFRLESSGFRILGGHDVLLMSTAERAPPGCGLATVVLYKRPLPSPSCYKLPPCSLFYSPSSCSLWPQFPLHSEYIPISLRTLPNSHRSVSSQCTSALTTLVTDSDVNACLTPSPLLPIFTSPNNSVITPIDNWLKSVCAAGPCSNSTLAKIVTTVTSGCSTEIAAFGIQSVNVAQVTQTVEQLYPSVREAFCLKESVFFPLHLRKAN